MSPGAVLGAVESGLRGLAERDAAGRLKIHGENRLPEKRSFTPLRIFSRQFASPLIYVLLVAGGLALLIGYRWDTIFIFGVLLLNAFVGAAQELKADASARALRALVPQKAIVRREGRVREVAAQEVVPGDLVELETGIRVTADLRLIEAQGLMVDESLLTGESMPVAKNPKAVLPDETLLADRTTLVYTGTTVIEGRALGVVVATGQHTALGQIGRTLEDTAGSAGSTPLVVRMRQLARQIGIAALGLIVILAAAMAIEGEGWREIALLGIALAVSAIPEGLPVAVTVALSAGAYRMAQENVIVRALPAVEGLGACTVIASDKTGTLTANRLSVERVVLADGTSIDRAAWIGQPVTGKVALLGMLAGLCNEARLTVDEVAVGDSVDVALLGFAEETGSDPSTLLAAPRLALVPYEPVQRYAAAEVDIGGVRRLVVKGAPETILRFCVGVAPSAIEMSERLARQGYRVLALADGPQDTTKGTLRERLEGLTFAGFVGLLDPLRPEVPEAIQRCREAGISVRMITGDHPATALAIARQLALAETSAEVVTGRDLADSAQDAEAFRQQVVRAKVFARIEPLQKLAIVRALQNEGEIVAVTGDGANDAPALQAAHIGVAMGRGGTDVARSTADLVLADDNFASIVAGIEEGRVTFLNVRKIVLFVLATGVAEICMFLAALAAGLPMPLTPVQLLWLNLVTNGVQDVTLGFGKGEGDEMCHRPHRVLPSLVDREALILMLPGAAVMTALTLWLFARELGNGGTVEEARNSVLLMMVLFQNAFLLGVRHLHLPSWRLRSENGWLFVGICAAIALQVGAMHFSPLQAMLGVEPVSIQLWQFSLMSALAVLIVTELSKRLARLTWVRRRDANRGNG
jgi:Ca2+-transporting ATPase